MKLFGKVERIDSDKVAHLSFRKLWEGSYVCTAKISIDALVEELGFKIIAGEHFIIYIYYGNKHRKGYIRFKRFNRIKFSDSEVRAIDKRLKEFFANPATNGTFSLEEFKKTLNYEMPISSLRGVIDEAISCSRNEY